MDLGEPTAEPNLQEAYPLYPEATEASDRMDPEEPSTYDPPEAASAERNPMESEHPLSVHARAATPRVMVMEEQPSNNINHNLDEGIETFEHSGYAYTTYRTYELPDSHFQDGNEPIPITEVIGFEPVADETMFQGYNGLDEMLQRPAEEVASSAGIPEPFTPLREWDNQNFGSHSLQDRIRDTLDRYSTIFQDTVLTEPAKVTPLELHVSEEKWCAPANKRQVRQQSPAKETEIQRQITEMLKLGVIKQCNDAQYYSQVHLVKKPNGRWRFCIDYRALNEATVTTGGVIPNIRQMLHDIGAKRPKIFAVLDLTSGFHQTELHPNSQKYTAFRTAHGQYEWIRVPMGIKGAPTYFQHHIGNEVLQDLLHRVSELYIDDIILFGW